MLGSEWGGGVSVLLSLHLSGLRLEQLWYANGEESPSQLLLLNRLLLLRRNQALPHYRRLGAAAEKRAAQLITGVMAAHLSALATHRHSRCLCVCTRHPAENVWRLIFTLIPPLSLSLYLVVYSNLSLTWDTSLKWNEDPNSGLTNTREDALDPQLRPVSEYAVVLISSRLMPVKYYIQYFIFSHIMLSYSFD